MTKEVNKGPKRRYLAQVMKLIAPETKAICMLQQHIQQSFFSIKSVSPFVCPVSEMVLKI